MKTAGIKKAARMKADRCFSNAMAAIDRLKKEGRRVTFASVMEEASVSRSYLYGNQYLRKVIEKEREADTPAASEKEMLLSAQSVEIKRLTREVTRLAKCEEQLAKLKQENEALKEQLKTAYRY